MLLLAMNEVAAFKPTARRGHIPIAKTGNSPSSQQQSLDRWNAYGRRISEMSLLENPDAEVLKPNEGGSSSIFFLLPNGLEWSAGLASILIVYLVQGATGITSLARTLFLKDTLGLDAAASTALLGLAAAPWLLKPIYGVLTDSVPIGGLRRQPYLVSAGILGAIAWLSLGTTIDSVAAAILAIGVSNLGIAFADVVADSLCVETARREGEVAGADKEQQVAAALQSLCWGSRFIGAIAAAAATGPLLEAFTPRQIFMGAASLPLAAAAAALLVDEEPVPAPLAGTRSGSEAALAIANQTFQGLKATVTQRKLWVPMAVVLFYLSTPNPGGAYLYFLTDDLKLSKSALGNLEVVGSVTSLLGVVLYQRFFDMAKPSRLIGVSSVASALLTIPQLLLVTHTNRALGVPDNWLIYGDEGLQNALGQVAFMPTLTLAARLCPPGQEGTLFALLMSAYNAAGIASSEVSALLTQVLGVTGGNFDGLPMLVSITGFTSLLPLPLLPLLDTAGEEDDDEK